MTNNIIGILGGAMAGALVALQYLRETESSESFKQTTVHLYDQNDQLFGKKSTSRNQSFKMHTGMHYMNDLETAKKCLLASIEFARAFPDCMMQKNSDRAPSHPDKYQDRIPGRFYIVSGGAISMDDRIETDGGTVKGARYIASELNKLYKEMVEKDNENAVFGPPEGFIKEIPISEDSTAPESINFTDKNGKNSIRIIEGIFEAREAQVDIDKMRARLACDLQAYQKSERLQIHLSTKVDAIQFDPDSMGYELKLRDLNNDALMSQKVNAVANCTWQNMLEVEKELPLETGALIYENKINVRGKISIFVQLPDGFEGFTTRIFSSGPFCSITMTNFERKEAVLTFSPKSDLEEYTAGQEKLPDWVLALTPENLTIHSKVGNDIAQEILKGCAHFIPVRNRLKERFLKDTKILEVRLAYVCSKKTDVQNYDLEDPHSPLHQRRESGIEQRFLGMVRYACIKMTYGPHAAHEVANILMQHLGFLQAIEKNISSYLELSSLSTLMETKRKITAGFRETFNRIIRIIQYRKEQETQLADILDMIPKMFLMMTSSTSMLITSTVIQSKSSALLTASESSLTSSHHSLSSGSHALLKPGSLTDALKK